MELENWIDTLSDRRHRPFFGVMKDCLWNSYAMVEMNRFYALIQPHDVYATLPWLVPLTLDKAGD